MKIFEIILETQYNYSGQPEINMLFEVLELLKERVVEAEFLAGNNHVEINIPTSHPHDWDFYFDELKNTLKMVLVCRNVSISTYPNYFDEQTIKKIDNMISNCEIRIDDLDRWTLEENQQYMADNGQSSVTSDRVDNGTHPFMKRADGSNVATDLLATGNHNSQIMKTCEHCGKTMGKLIFGRYHGDKCKKPYRSRAFKYIIVVLNPRTGVSCQYRPLYS